MATNEESKNQNKNHYFQKQTKIDKMSRQLPLQPPLKITSSAVYVGEPKQLVDLLASEVAQPVIEIHRTKGGMPLFKCLLRCKTLFAGNLPVYFLTDFPNVPLKLEERPDGKAGVVMQAFAPGTSPDTEVSGFVDDERAKEYFVHLEQAIAFWGERMEDEVSKVYTDKTPKHVGAYATDGIISMSISSFQGKPFDAQAFLDTCVIKRSFPCFKISFGWINSVEDPRSKEHAWGFKFEMSMYAQQTEVRKARAAGASSSSSVEAAKKKRKAELESSSEKVEIVAEEPVA
jgi:hypothetical protein